MLRQVVRGLGGGVQEERCSGVLWSAGFFCVKQRFLMKVSQVDFENGVDYGLFVRGDLVVEAIGLVDVGVVAVDVINRLKVAESVLCRPLSAQVRSILSDDDAVDFIVGQTEDSDAVVLSSVVRKTPVIRKNIHAIFDFISSLYAVYWQIVAVDRINANQESDASLRFSDTVSLQVYQHASFFLQVDIVFRADDRLSDWQPFLVMVS